MLSGIGSIGTANRRAQIETSRCTRADGCDEGSTRRTEAEIGTAIRRTEQQSFTSN